MKTPEDLYKNADQVVLRIVTQILDIEKDYLHNKKPLGITEDLLKIFAKEVRDEIWKN